MGTNDQIEPQHLQMTEPARALWHVGDGVGVFAGSLGRNKRHSHAVPVLMSGIYGSFLFRIGEGDWFSCRTAVVPPGLSYEFDMRGDPLSVLYLEPTLADVECLTPLIEDVREENGALIGVSGTVPLMRELFEDAGSQSWAHDALRDLVCFSLKRQEAQMDPRVMRTIEHLQLNFAELTPVADLARDVGLSISRFQHLFSAAVGVPFRRYRAWHRMRAAIREISLGRNFTQAAHIAGFSDQSHFNKDFLRMFGAPPGQGLRLRR